MRNTVAIERRQAGQGRAVRPGWAFKGDKLYRFAGDTVTVIRTWPDLRAWRLPSPTDRWLGYRPANLDLREIAQTIHRSSQRSGDGSFAAVRGFRSNEVQALHRFYTAIPRYAADAAMVYSWDHVPVLFALARLGRAGEDLVSCGAFGLLYLLAHADKLALPKLTHPWRSLRRWSALPQHRIAERFGFPGRPAVSRLLRRLTPTECNPFNLGPLQQVSRDEKRLRRLCHLRRINGQIMALIAHPHALDHCPGGLLSELSQLPYDVPMISKLHLGLRILDRGGRWPRLRGVRSWSVLQEMLLEEATEAGEPWRRSWPFPDPPGGDYPSGCEPIENMAELSQEGRAMGHCVGSYAQQIERGNYYCFRIHADATNGIDRSTLGLARDTDGVWLPVQLRGYGNAQVSEATWQLARELTARC